MRAGWTVVAKVMNTWVHQTQDTGQGEDCCSYGHEHLGSIKGWEFLRQLSDHQLL